LSDRNKEGEQKDETRKAFFAYWSIACGDLLLNVLKSLHEHKKKQKKKKEEMEQTWTCLQM